MLNDAVKEVLNGAHVAHFVTLNADGSPQVSLVWVGLDGEEVVAAHLGAWQKVRNIERDPWVVISFETNRVAANGLAEYLVLHGTARVTEGGAAELLQELAHCYLGPEVVFPPMDNPPAGFVTHVSVARISGVGPWT